MQNLKIAEKHQLARDRKIQLQVDRKNITRVEAKSTKQGGITLNMVRKGSESEIMEKLVDCYNKIIRSTNGKIKIDATYY